MTNLVTPLTPKTPRQTKLQSTAASLLWPIVVRESSRHGTQLLPVDRFHFAAAVIPAIQGHMRCAQMARMDDDADSKPIYEEHLRDSRKNVVDMLSRFGAADATDEILGRYATLCQELTK